MTFLLLILVLFLLWLKITPNPPVLFFNVLSESMTPIFFPGDFVISKKVKLNKLEIGDIITFKANEEVLTHRIVEIEQKDQKRYFITQGDANNIPDLKPVEPNQIMGEYVLSIPKLGRFSEIIQTNPGRIALVLTFVQIVLVQMLISIFLELLKEEKEVLVMTNQKNMLLQGENDEKNE